MEAGQIRTSQSSAADPVAAVREVRAQLEAETELELVVFFCSTSYDLDRIAAELNRSFSHVPQVVGCTTAGEIGPAGYQDRSLSAIAFCRPALRAVSGRIDHLQQFKIAQGFELAHALQQQLDSLSTEQNRFGFLLIDGISLREEPVAHALQKGLGKTVLFGGSAADDLKLGRTWVFHEGQFRSDCAVLLLAATALPFRIFKTQHFVSEQERLVVTEADASRRLVKEINALPAAEEYARAVGVGVEDLGPGRFAASPLVVAIDGTDYVRSIQKANPDGSLSFYCAIDEGLVLRVVRGVDLVGNLQQALTNLEAEIGPPQGVIACDCILRKLEITQQGLRETVGDIFRRHHVVGFSTYGEQFRGVHVNQTLTGIAFGPPSPSDGSLR